MQKEHPLRLFHFCPRCGSERFVERNEKAKSCRQCGFQYYNNISAAVAAFILSPQGELLLCKRAKEPAKGLLDLTGGFVDSYETAEDAIKREIKEELNLEVVNATYLFSIPNLYLYSDFTVHTLDLFYQVDIADFTTLRCDDDVADANFYAIDQIKIEDIGLQSIKTGVARFIKNQI